MDNNKKIILCFVNYYLPSYRSGGPVRTISNFVEQLGDEFEIKIICSNHEFGDTRSYHGIAQDTWQKVGKAKVFYASNKKINIKGVQKLLNETLYDVLYLNSFFNFNYSILPLLIIYFKLSKKKPCVIAPRGEFSIAALKIKSFKKRCFLWLAKAIGLYQNLYWQASSDFEENDIKKEMDVIANDIYIAPNLTSLISKNDKDNSSYRKPGPLRIVFLSRISPMKNLNFILSVLQKINFEINFSIYGPKEDNIYWDNCLKLINKLSSNINVSINEEVPNEKVQNIFKENDLFVFPTLGENFGHIIFESLKAGTPVLVSDKTPWKSNKLRGLQSIPLDENLWEDVINEWSKLDDSEITQRRKDAYLYVLDYQKNNDALKKNKHLFNSILKNSISLNDK